MYMYMYVCLPFRLKLENVEAEHRALEKEQARVQELQEDLQQQRLINQQTVEQNHQTREVNHICDALTFYWCGMSN